MAVVADVIMSGLDAAKPAAATSNAGFLYFSTDVAGGTLYRSTGSAWVAVAPGVSSGGSVTFVGARAKKSGTQSINDGAGTVLTWDQEDFDTDGFHSTVTNTGRMTVPTGKAGKYLIEADAEWNGATGWAAIYLRLNGTTGIGGHKSQIDATFGGSVSVAAIYNLAVADYVEALVYQKTGGAVNVATTNFGVSHFSVALLGS